MKEPYKLKLVHLENIFLLIFSCVVILSARSYYGWGYDEYGAVISHIELDDPRFLDVYKEKLIGFGFYQWTVNYLLIPMLSAVIVPIRWTYALGISPLYALARVDVLSWDQIKMLITFLHVATVIAGLKLILLSISPGYKRTTFLIIILSIALFSHSFIYWMGTFTSYSLHTLCFGLLLFGESNKKAWHNSILGKTSVTRSIIILSNYQYLPVLVVIGLHELITKKIVFFTDKSYQNWVIPGIISCASIYIISMRLNLIGSDVSPGLNFAKATQYLIPYGPDLDSVLSTLQFFVSRLIDIGHYFFFTAGQLEYFRSENFTALSIVSTFIIILAFGSIVAICLRSAHLRDSKFLIILRISALILVVQMFLYLLNVVPTSPTRHSFIIFWPLVSGIAILFLTLTKNTKIESSVLVGSLLLFFSSAYGYYLGFDDSRQRSISEEPTSCLIAQEVTYIVLEPCFLQPILENRATTFIYSCGLLNVDKIPEDVVKIGLLTTEDWTESDAEKLFTRYSNQSWTRNKPAEIVLKDCLSESSIAEHERHTNTQIYEHTE